MFEVDISRSQNLYRLNLFVILNCGYIVVVNLIILMQGADQQRNHSQDMKG